MYANVCEYALYKMLHTLIKSKDMVNEYKWILVFEVESIIHVLCLSSSM